MNRAKYLLVSIAALTLSACGQGEVDEREDAINTFAELGEAYKVEIIKDIIPEGEEVSIYRQGDWFDVCRGPHLPSTGKLPKAFKLMKLAGAYWRGDSNNEMLQRIYGTAWSNDKQLRTYLRQLEEAEKRDHRRLGRIMDLFVACVSEPEDFVKDLIKWAKAEIKWAMVDAVGQPGFDREEAADWGQRLQNSVDDRGRDLERAAAEGTRRAEQAVQGLR